MSPRAELAADIVDSHVHLLPGRLGAKVRAFFEARLADNLAYPMEHRFVCERLAQAGVVEAWSLPYAHKPGIAEGLNVASSRMTGGSPIANVQVIGGATVHVGDADPVGVVRHAFVELGLPVLKLHCSVGAFSIDDARLESVWSYVSDHRLPVVVHAGHDVSGATTAAELAPIERVAARFDKARIIIAHCGHPAVRHAVSLVETYPNVFADLTPVVREPVAIDPASAARCADKLLFGTDAPNVARTAEQSLADLGSLGLDPNAVAMITAGNARRLMGEVGEP